MVDTDIIKRFALFLFGCITVRTLFVIVAKVINKDYLPILGIIALIIGLGFLIIYLGGYRKTGPEVMGQEIWWNDLRPVHALLYFTFAILAFRKSDYAFIPLLLDVFIGIGAFIYYHYTSNNFVRIFK
jgi:hypothetical protein